ncbi:acetyltransferase [Pedobacter sp. HMWF019]|uniref:acetyltransferase n=1 Tax=Pedobacter sp. HMWF019 TaxID=2056856 RepID=UPI000D3CC6EA|nr:acetyltransferase [Pedobacter sp. HMWF019]PTS95971.1 acetyltransferase [Pedobacter sp. HMWF019]
MMNVFRRYGFLGVFHLICSKIITMIIMPKAKIIRLPIDIRNKGLMKIGKGFTTGRGCRLEVEDYEDKRITKLFIGENVQLNDSVHITAMEKVIIGNNVLMASKIYISDCSHGSYAGDEFDSRPDSKPQERLYKTSPVYIEDNVWLGEFVSVLPGVTIGEGSIIGTMSVVTKSIPPYSIAVGTPAKVIKQFNFDTNNWQKI